MHKEGSDACLGLGPLVVDYRNRKICHINYILLLMANMFWLSPFDWNSPYLFTFIHSSPIIVSIYPGAQVNGRAVVLLQECWHNVPYNHFLPCPNGASLRVQFYHFTPPPKKAPTAFSSGGDREVCLLVYLLIEFIPYFCPIIMIPRSLDPPDYPPPGITGLCSLLATSHSQ